MQSQHPKTKSQQLNCLYFAKKSSFCGVLMSKFVFTFLPAFSCVYFSANFNTVALKFGLFYLLIFGSTKHERCIIWWKHHIVCTAIFIKDSSRQTWCCCALPYKVGNNQSLWPIFQYMHKNIFDKVSLQMSPQIEHYKTLIYFKLNSRRFSRPRWYI